MDASPPGVGSSRIRLSSNFLFRQVFLYDWWLIKIDSASDGKDLGVGGLVSEQQVGLRVFRSAPIMKRRSTNVLETVDGITITVAGSINRSLTVQMGFSSEICSHFLIGFPYYWEDFARQSSAEGSSYRAGISNHSLANSVDDLPLTWIRDFLHPSCQVSGVCEMVKDISENVERTSDEKAVNGEACLGLPLEGTNQVMAGKTQHCKTPSKKSNVLKHKLNSPFSVAHSRTATAFGTDFILSRRCTRSMSRLITEGHREENSLPNASSKTTPRNLASVSNGLGKEQGSVRGTKLQKNSPNLHLATRKLIKGNHSPRTTEESRQEESFLANSSSKNTLSQFDHVSDVFQKQCGGAVDGMNISSATMSTRILTLRSRSVAFHMEGIL